MIGSHFYEYEWLRTSCECFLGISCPATNSAYLKFMDYPTMNYRAFRLFYMCVQVPKHVTVFWVDLRQSVCRNFWLGRCLCELFYWAFATWEWSSACQYNTVMRVVFLSNYDSLCAIIFDRDLNGIYDECGIRSSACQYKMRECNQLICQTVLNFYDWLPTYMNSSWTCDCF
jgi:hypothetical protein